MRAADLKWVRDHQGNGGDSEDTLFNAIAASIHDKGYVVLPGALPPHVAENLIETLAHIQEASFNQAGVGRGDHQLLNPFIRRDKIHWIDPTFANAQDWLAWTARLQVALNRRLLLGLFSFESHFALYEPGDFYQKHVDAFKGASNRVLSIVTYLNRDWEPCQGGELVLYHPTTGDVLTKVTPAFGSVVVFLSEEFPHEVLAANRTRYSVAGWFRVNTSLPHRVDPPR